MSESPLPIELLRQVERDLRPVRPLAAPVRRTVALVPCGLLLLFGVPSFWGWRENLAAFGDSWLGFATMWGLSGVQTLVGLLIVGAGLREAVPGRALSSKVLAVIITSAVVVVVGATLLTDIVLPTATPRGVWLRWAWECTEIALVSALPGLVLVAWVASRALPSRPAVAGAIYGLGAGLLADSGVRLFCWTSEPAHVLIAHGGAIAMLMALGALLSTLIERARARRRRTRQM
jgi:hypothetical protein